MIDRCYGDYYVTCDACGKELDGVFSDFDEARDSMKTNGWRTRRIGDDWFHYCPECAPEMARPGADEFSGVR